MAVNKGGSKASNRAVKKARKAASRAGGDSRAKAKAVVGVETVEVAKVGAIGDETRVAGINPGAETEMATTAERETVTMHDRRNP